MIFSDHLSRNVDKDVQKLVKPTCKGLELKIEDVYVNASNDKCVSLAMKIDKDENLVILKSQIIKGWLSQRAECPRNIADYWNYIHEISILEGLVQKHTRIIVPKQCRDEILEKLYEGHFGVDRTKL